MAGRQYIRVRVVTSEKLISPLAGRRDFEQSAIDFINGIKQSAATPRLVPDIAAKALVPNGRPTYDDTDGKKRTSSGGPAGMVELSNGWRFDPNATYEEGKTFKFFPSEQSKESQKKQLNFGWVDKPKSLSVEEFSRREETRPRPRFRKYEVSKKTGEIIESSEVELDPFSPNGESVEQNNRLFEKQQTKMLGGRPLSSRVPGGGLLARTAARIGIIIDENNKLRCPPGTPAANQFTDAFGTNCFGISANRLVNAALDKAAELGGEEKFSGFRNTVSNLLGFLYDLDNGKYGGAFARNVWYDAKTGERIKDIRKWRDVNLPEETRWFKNGMANATDRLRVQDERVSRLYDLLGVIRTPDKRERNDDVFAAFDVLRARGMWDGEIAGRYTPEQVDAIIMSRLQNVEGFSELPIERQRMLVKADTARYYENERAMMESFLEFLYMNPENANDIKVLNFENKGDGDEASAAAFGWGKSGIQGTMINVDIPKIMDNQESMLPGLKPYERLRIDIVGAKSEAEAASALSDFMISMNQAARSSAAMVDGPKGFARHIMVHEIAHTMQIMAFADEIQRQIASKGYITVTGPKGNRIQIDDARKLTSSHIMQIMKRVGDDVDLGDMGDSLSRTEVMAMVAGRYPAEIWDSISRGEGGTKELWGLEAQAELFALRDLGLIHGDDVDAALTLMDGRLDAGHARRRATSDAADFAKIEDLYYSPFKAQEISEPVVEDVKARKAAETRQHLDEFRKEVGQLEEADMVSLAAELRESTDAMEEALEEAKEAGISDPELEERVRLNAARLERVEKAWKKKYGIESRRDIKTFYDAVDRFREDNGMFSDDVMSNRVRQREMEGIVDESANMSEEELVRRLADYEVALSDRSLSKESRKMLSEERNAYKKAWEKIQKESGDDLTKAQREKKLKSEIDELVEPTKTKKIKTTKKFASNKKAREYADERRSELIKTASFAERTAIVELADTNGSKIAQFIDPETQVLAGKAINKRHRRLQRLGLETDPKNKEQATLEQQVENILIPAMNLIDRSSMADALEIEGVVDLDVDPATGEISMANDIAHDGFITGRIINSRDRFDGNLEAGNVANTPGKQRKKVIIQVGKGDKGIFPHWSFDKEKDNNKQSLTIPPGTLRVVEVRDDGTVVARVRNQKDTDSVLNDLVNSMGEEGPGFQNTKGTKAKVQRVVDRHFAEKRERAKGIGSDNAVEISRNNDSAISSVKSSGGSFGEAPSAEYVKRVETAADDVLGKPATKRQRTVARTKAINDGLDEIDAVMSGKESKSFPELTKDSVDPEVARVISQTPRPELIKQIEETAVKMHEGFDRRVRVRATEEDIKQISETGAMRPASLEEPKQPINQKEVAQQYSGFKTAAGSRYVYNKDGTVSREKNPETSTTLDDGEIVRSTFENTRFVSEADLKNIQIAFDRGIPFNDDGSIRALRYDDTNLDSDNFLMLRRNGVPFDEAYKSSGGTITSYKPELSLEPAVGTHPWEWNNNGKRWHSGSMVVEVNARPDSGALSETRRAVRRSGKGTPRPPRSEKLSSGLKPPSKPKRPREPDNGPFTGKFADIFRGAKSYQEMLDRYNEQEIVFFDYETTGFDPADGNMPVQIGAVRMKGGQVVGRFNVFVNPGRPLGEWAKKNLKDENGNPLTDEYLAARPSIKDAHEQLIAFMGPDALLGGQYTPFDLEVLNRMLKQEGLEYTPGGVIDSKAIADELLPRWTPENPVGPSDLNKETGQRYGSNSLGPLSEYLGVQLDAWHTADADSAASAMATQKMLELAARGEAISDAMLDVDGMPERQRLKKERYDAAMVQYKKDKQEYERAIEEFKRAELDEALSRRPEADNEQRPAVMRIAETTEPDVPGVKRSKSPIEDTDRLSSGAPSKTLKPGSLGRSPKSLESDAFSDEYGQLKSYRTDVYDVDGESVIFGGNAGANWGQNVKNVSINPYEISGNSLDSEEGRQTAIQWTSAHAARLETMPEKPSTYVDALLYAGSRGDDEAMQEFERLAEIGEKRIQQAREDRANSAIPERYRDAIKQEGLENLSIDDLYLVHETRYELPTDTEGNIVLRPLGDYELETTSGEKVRYERDTLHFALNHLAQGHVMRQREKGTSVVVIPLSAVMEQNPESIDTLYPVDTFITPKPGKGLVLPKDRIRVIKNDDSVDDIDSAVGSALKEMGAKHIFKKGEANSSMGADAAVFKLANENGFNYGLHADSPNAAFESINGDTVQRFEVDVNSLSKMSGNSRARMAKTGRWSGSKVTISDDSLFSGNPSGTRSKPRRAAEAFVTSRATGKLIDAVLKRSGADEDTREMVEFGMGVATAFAAGGPAGAVAMVAREAAQRGGRELAEYTLNEMVKRGKISDSQAQLALRKLDRIAPEGLPDPVVEKLKDGFEIASQFYDERIDTPENRERISRATNEVRSSLSQRARSLKGRISRDRRDVPTLEDDSWLDGLSSGGTKKRSGRSVSGIRKEYEKRIGLNSGSRSNRPVYGYVVHKSHVDEKAAIAQSRSGKKPNKMVDFEVGDEDVIGDGLTAFGDYEIVLKPEVSDRTAYGRGDSLENGTRPVLMNSSDKQDIADALISSNGRNAERTRLEASINMIASSLDGNFAHANAGITADGKFAKVGSKGQKSPRSPYEAQILGGFKASEIESVNIPYSKIASSAMTEDVSDVVNDKSIKQKLEALGYTDAEIDYFYSVSGVGGISSNAMSQLREYRAAKRKINEINAMGIGSAKISHPDGTSIMDPTTYDWTANPNSDVEEILKPVINDEINEYLENMLSQMRKNRGKQK